MNKLKNIDFILIITVLSIIIFGIIMIYSASFKGEGIPTEVRRQIIFFFIGIISMSFMITIDYDFWGKSRWHIYIFTILLLIFVLLKGDNIRGAQSWITLGSLGRFQPSELAKLAIIITLAKTLSLNEEKINKINVVIKIGLHVGIPILLIILQPDMGTSLVLITIVFTMLFCTGVNPLYLMGVIILSGGIMPFFLKEYQWKRLTVFINAHQDPTGAGWNIIQSQIAVGSGQILGKGYLAGTQSHLNFVPENTTDFIFSVIGEEFGFIGCTLLLGGYFLIIWKGINIARTAKDTFSTLMAIGIIAMFMSHILENIGMNIGIMPITGIPLPFVSVGGSSLITNMMAIGLLLNIKSKSQRTLF
ncbi:MAG TPA: rod shape-determining protein RodA [Candidatus Eremiobacteraeota bacterium]|nr:rod shape-determining protein RodA [Candidatus Eremiobacteraeota bacterium]